MKTSVVVFIRYILADNLPYYSVWQFISYEEAELFAINRILDYCLLNSLNTLNSQNVALFLNMVKENKCREAINFFSENHRNRIELNLSTVMLHDPSAENLSQETVARKIEEIEYVEKNLY